MGYLYSQWSDKGYLMLNAENNVAKMFEMLGLYLTYREKYPSGADFSSYFQENENIHPYHFRNKGEKAVRDCLAKMELSNNRIYRHHSRRNFRLLSRTWRGLPVIASDDMGAIFSVLSDMLRNISDTAEALRLLFPAPSSVDILGFQHRFLTDYALPNAHIKSSTKRAAFRAVYYEWKNNPLFSL